jgi:transcriptional regulator with XRE-family HTH domain
MKRKNMSQADIGRHMGVSRSAVNWWASGKTYPSIDNVKDLAALLDTTPEWLLFGLHSVSSTTANVHIQIAGRGEDAFITLPLDFLAKAKAGTFSHLQGVKITGSQGTQIAIANLDDIKVEDTPKMMVMKNRDGGNVVKAYRSPNKTNTIIVEDDDKPTETLYKPSMFIGRLAAMVETHRI